MQQGSNEKKQLTWLDVVEQGSSFIKSAFVYIGSTIGLFTAGLTPALTFGYSLYHALSQIDGWSSGVAKSAGFALAITMEVVGSISAYVMQKATGWTKVFAGFILLLYTGIGIGYMWKFEQNLVVRQISFVAYLVSLLVYIVVPLFTATIEDIKDKAKQEHNNEQEAMEARVEAKEAERLANEAKQRQDEQDRLFEFNKQQKELQWQHEERERQAQRDHEARLLEIEAQKEIKLARSGKKVVESNGKVSEKDTVIYWPKLPQEDKEIIATLTKEQVMKRYNVSDKTARNWLKNAMQIVKFSTKLSANGNGVH